MRASAIIVAAGSGSRLGLHEPKAFVKLCGRPMLDYSLAAAGRAPSIEELVITVPPGTEERVLDLVRAAEVSVPVKITRGGGERQDSVRIALEFTSAEAELIIVHDAARPFADPELFERCLEAAGRSGGAIAAIALADTLKRVESGAITATVSRADIYQAQTPQAFRRDLLKAAHQRAMREHISATDDADLVERMGARVEIVEGSARNLKVTTRTDLEIASAIAETIAGAMCAPG